MHFTALHILELQVWAAVAVMPPWVWAAVLLVLQERDQLHTVLVLQQGDPVPKLNRHRLVPQLLRGEAPQVLGICPGEAQKGNQEGPLGKVKEGKLKKAGGGFSTFRHAFFPPLKCQD